MDMNIVTVSQTRISGYASVFGRPDLSGDIVRPGAFSASLLSQSPLRLPMLFGHETALPIGVWDRLVEDKTGLFVSGRIIGGADNADRTQRLVSAGAVSGLSIGYRTRRAAQRAGGGRDLFELDLWEVSVVAFPMLRDARITQINDQASPYPHTQRSLSA